MDPAKFLPPGLGGPIFGVLFAVCSPVISVQAAEEVLGHVIGKRLSSSTEQSVGSSGGQLIRIAGAKGDFLALPNKGDVVIEPAAQMHQNTLLEDDDKPDSSESETEANDELLDADAAEPASEDATAQSDDELLDEDPAETEAEEKTTNPDDELLAEDPAEPGSESEAAKSDDGQPEETAQSGDELLDGDDENADKDDVQQSESNADDELLDTADTNSPDDASEAVDDLLDAKVAEPDDAEQNDEPEQTAKADGEQEELSADEQHLNLFVENRYPSASTCGTCHPKHFKEWSVSQHAYAQMSPIYLSLNNKINELTNGSNGDFCLRCHTPVGANLGESSFVSNMERHPTSREGITCVVCHRINKAYNKASGRLALVEGGLTEPIYGPTGNAGLSKVLDQPNKFRVVTDPKDSGRKIHNESKLFAGIRTPIFCGTCHDVTLFNGFRLEEAFSEYRVSPAAAKGITCQDCHMGKIQGVPSGYERGPAAVVGDVPTAPRRLASHLFSGPDYPVIHPGIFPHNQEASAFKTIREWLQFKHKEGWGTDKFEDSVSDDYKFPEAWASVDDRYDAREILNKQFELLDYAKKKRLEILKNGFKLADVVADRDDERGIAFRVKVKNGTDGHNVPTGFTGERLVWLQVTVKDRDGKVVFKSGDRDPNGDLRDGHSSYVHAGKIKQDPYLFSLQSIFVTQNGRGGEIEHVIPIPFPQFALPRVLPSTASLIFTGEPATERNHKKGIEPNGHRWASYKISGDALTGKPPYTANIKLKAQAVPINLLTSIQDVGFDFNMTPMEVGKNLIAGTQVLAERNLTLDTPVSATPSALVIVAQPEATVATRRAKRQAKKELDGR